MSVEPEGEESDTYYEGYSDYQSVSQDIGSSVADAIDGYSLVVSSGGGRLDRSRASTAKGYILAAALRLLPEVEESKAAKPELGEIYERWTGDDGYIQSLEEISLATETPGWLREFVLDIRKSAWKVGYLRAAEKRSDSETDIDVKQSEQMFSGL